MAAVPPRPVVWIAAQPGAGKTSLVSSYLEARGLPGIWYQVDSGDSGSSVFIPKRRKKKLFGVLRRHLGEVFRELAKHKEYGGVGRASDAGLRTLQPCRVRQAGEAMHLGSDVTRQEFECVLSGVCGVAERARVNG